MGNEIEGEYAEDYFGVPLEINSLGSILAVGAPAGEGEHQGYTKVYEWSGGLWSQRGQTLWGQNTGDQFGCSLSLNDEGNILAVGASHHFGDSIRSGEVQVFNWSGVEWVQMGNEIEGEYTSEYFGFEVSLSNDGSTLAIASGLDFVRVFQWNGIDWQQIGQDIHGAISGPEMPTSVTSLSLNEAGNILAIGDPLHNVPEAGDLSGFFALGHVRVFSWNGLDWEQMGEDIDGVYTGELAGGAVSLSDEGDLLAVGSPTWFSQGFVRVYQWNGSEWLQRGQEMEGDQGDRAGISVSLSGDGNILAYGAELGGMLNENGEARILSWNGSEWLELGNPIEGSASFDWSGASISLSTDGSRVAIGAPMHDNGGIFDPDFMQDIGHVRVFHTEEIMTVTLMEPTKISETIFYPNPSSTGRFFIRGITLPEVVEIRDAQLQLVKIVPVEHNEIDISDLPNGVYLATTLDSSGHRFVKRLVIMM